MSILGMSKEELAKRIGATPEELQQIVRTFTGRFMGMGNVEPAMVGMSRQRHLHTPMIQVDFGRIEAQFLASRPSGKEVPDMHTHIANVTGLERTQVKDMRFSDIYGMNREDMVHEYGEHFVQITTMRFLRKYPIMAHSAKLRKSRARMMVAALQGASVKGNQEVRLEGRLFIFSFRGTDILSWDTEPAEGLDGISPIDTLAFEGTSSTRTQRKEAEEAIAEFKEVVLQL